MANIKTTIIDYAIENADGCFLANQKSNCLQSIFGCQHFYGCCGDTVGLIDSRTHTDEEILDAIRKLLCLGHLVPKDSLAYETLQLFFDQRQ